MSVSASSFNLSADDGASFFSNSACSWRTLNPSLYRDGERDRLHTVAALPCLCDINCLAGQTAAVSGFSQGSGFVGNPSVGDGGPSSGVVEKS